MPRTKSKDKMELISVHIPKKMLDELERLVEMGKYPNRSEAIRDAIRRLIDQNADSLREGKAVKPSEAEAEEGQIVLLKGR